MGGSNSMKLAYVAVEDRECNNCGEKGHMSYNCPNPRGSGGRGGTRGGRGSSRGGLRRSWLLWWRPWWRP